MSINPAARLLALAMLGAMAGCAYSGGIDRPLVQKVAWFS